MLLPRQGMVVRVVVKVALDPCQTKEWRQAAEPAYTCLYRRSDRGPVLSCQGCDRASLWRVGLISMTQDSRYTCAAHVVG